MKMKQTNLKSEICRYASIYAALWKNSVVREMGFKSNFILWIFVEFLWFLLQISFVAILYRQTESIGDWTKWQVVMLVATSHFIQQLFIALFLTNCTQLSEYVRTGKLDFMLLLPVNTRFLVSFRLVDLGGFVNAASALAVLGYAGRQLHLNPSFLQLGIFGMFVVAGVAFHYSLMLMLAATSFWTVRSQGIVWGYYNLFSVARMPDSALRGMFKAFFTLVVPMLLVSNVPTKVLADKLVSVWDAVFLLAMAVLFFVLSELVWRISLRGYTSASS
jgi:ABC-2 type transport system permease protein